MDRKEAFLRGIHDGIPIGLGYFAVSFSFGMMAVGGGLTVLQAALLSFSNLTSAGQFAGLQIMIAGGSCWELILSQVVINLRYCLMSFSLSQKLDRSFPWAHRYLVSYGVTDEIFGVSISQSGKLSPYYSYGAICMAVPGWTLGTAVGAICGNILPQVVISALSVALYGMFLAVIVPPARDHRPVLGVVLAAMALSTVFAYTPVLSGISSGFVIIIITLVVSGIAAAVCPVKEEEA